MSRWPTSCLCAGASVFAIALFLATPVSAQGPWTIAQVIGTLGGSSNSSSVADINGAGQVVGSSQTAGGVSHAFIWTFAGGMIDLGTLGGNTSSARAINNLGQVVGSSATATGQNHAFLWSQATGMVDLGAFGGARSSATDINDSGMVVINVTDAAGGTKAYRWTEAGGLINLGTLGGNISALASTFGVAINSSGWVTGSSPSLTACTTSLPTCNGWPHAFLWKPTTGIADLGFLGSRNTEGNALGMNNAGQVVGYIEHAFAVSANAAFSWTATSGMVRVTPLGGTENEAEDVNDSGLIVGSSFLAGDFVSHAFAAKIGTATVDLGTLGGTSSQASAVNSAGVIVGSALNSAGAARAVVWYPAAPTVTTNPLDLGVTPGTSAAFTATASGLPPPTVQWWVSTNGGTSYSSIAGATSGTYAFVAGLADSGKKFRAVFTNSAGTATTTAATLSVTTTLPTMTLDKTALIMSAVTTGTSLGARTSQQIVRLTQTGSGIVTWTAASTAPWLLVSPVSGTGSATLRISPQFASGLTASQTASINLTFIGAGNTAGPITVTLATFLSTQATAPVGSFDTPIDGTTGVAGSIAVTGWALDDVEVTAVRILRDPVAGEPAGALVFIGNAVLVEGARPDIQAMFPNAPLNTRAGWGYLMLTNFLPGLGNGTFKLWAIADDADGHSTTLGGKTIVCANGLATAPFGAIDTPFQGGAVSGSAVANFGWVLSPSPRRADPPSGTVQVVIDGAFISTVPSGWTSRSDLAALFPAAQFPGIVNALGVAVLDSTAFTNGVHTISWVVTDNLGSASGIGSRYFTISNSAGQSLAPAPSPLAESASIDAGVEGRRGWDALAPFEALPVDSAGVPTMQAEELDRIELRVRARAGHLRNQIGNQRLPIGSRIDPADGTFSWLPGPGFVGIYEFVFDTPEGPRDVRVRLNPQGSLTRPQVVIDLPAAETRVGSTFTIAGWAFDPAARGGTGISSLHVWAYPVRGGTPTFLGSATQGGRRPDVAAIYGDRFQDSGFGLVAAGLPPGTYDLAVFPWSDSAGRFLSATVVRVVVR